MTTLRHLSLFSGGGIGTLAAKSAGIETVAHVENDPACMFVLRKLWPGVPCFEDVKEFGGEQLATLGRIDIISGGFPCQDISTAGKGAGIEGARSGLWFEFARIIREARPAWVLIENVPALRVRGGDRVCADLEAMAYEWEAVVVGSDDVGAPHRRKRVWIVGRLENSSHNTDRNSTGQVAIARWNCADDRKTDVPTWERREDNQPDAISGNADPRDGSLGDSTGTRYTQTGSESGGCQRADSDARRGFRECKPCDASDELADGASIGRESERNLDGRQLADHRCELADAIGGMCGRRSAEQERGPKGGIATRWTGQTGIADPSEDHMRVWSRMDCEHGERSTLVYSVSEMPANHIGDGHVHARWPSRPGQPQHEWEATRLVEFGVGGATDGMARRVRSRSNKSCLRILGNGWQYQVAEMMFRAIVKLDSEQ